jgi:hypothetical protein
MERNDELDDLLSDNTETPAETPEAPEETPTETPEEEEVPETPGESEEPPELVEALTEREAALIAQLTDSDPQDQDPFDMSVPPTQNWSAEPYTFLKEEENIDEILGDPAKFNAKMAQLYNDALQRGAQLALEAAYKNYPRVISVYAKQQIETTNMVNDFYQQNKDLVPLKPALARIAQKIGTEHPEYTLTQLLGESAKAARTLFKLKTAPSTPSAKGTRSTPAFVGQKGGSNRLTRPKSGTTIEDEVMDLIS